MYRSHYTSGFNPIQKVDDLLSHHIADFSSFSSGHQHLLRMMIQHLSDVETANNGFPFDFNLSLTFLACNKLPFVLGDNLHYSNSLISVLFPDDRPFFEYAELYQDPIAKHYSASNRNIIHSKFQTTSCLRSPLLVSFNIDAQRKFSLKNHDYVVLAVDLTNDDALLRAIDLKNVVENLAIDDDILIKPITKNLEIGFLVQLATGSSFGFDLKFTRINQFDHSTFCYVILPVSLENAFCSVLNDIEIANCGLLTFVNKNGALTIGNESVVISSLILENLLIEISQKKISQNDHFSFLPRGNGRLYEEKPFAIEDLMDNLEFVSTIELEECFNSEAVSSKKRSRVTPYGTFLEIPEVGNYFISLSTSFVDIGELESIENIIRPVFEHHAFAGDPVSAKVLLLISTEHSTLIDSIIKEIQYVYDLFSISCSVEYIVNDSIGSNLLFTVGLISKACEKSLECNSLPAREGDLIYALNYDFTEGSSNLEALRHTGLLISYDEIRYLERQQFIRACSPVSHGGVIGTLYYLSTLTNLGFEITSFDELPPNIFLNAATIGHIIVIVDNDREHQFVDYLVERKIPVTLLGQVIKDEIIIDDVSFGNIADLKKKTSFAFRNNFTTMESNKKVVKPYNKSKASKKEQVANMFDNIAPQYDFLNHFLSFGIDKIWRRRLVREVGKYQPAQIVDVATGTGDLAIALSKIKPQSIVGIDISTKMIEVGIDKIKSLNLSDTIVLMAGDSENINFDSNTFDAASVAFGVRNFENPRKGLSELYRVLKPGGVLAVLEFAMPTKFPIKQLYKFYFFHVLPFIGRFFSKDNSAYSYLPESVEAFPSGDRFKELLHEAGFTKTRIIPLSFGIANIYIGEK